MSKAATLAASLALVVGMVTGACGTATNATASRATDAQVMALARLDRPTASSIGQHCVATWLRAHVPEGTLARYVQAKTPEEGLRTPGLPSSLLTANAACARELTP